MGKTVQYITLTLNKSDVLHNELNLFVIYEAWSIVWREHVSRLFYVPTYLCTIHNIYEVCMHCQKRYPPSEIW